MSLRITGMACGYRGLPVLEDVDLTIEPGELVAVLGPNGVGKSTLMKTIMGVLPGLAGRLELAGEDLTAASALTRSRRGIAWVPEGRRLFASLSVRENLLVSARGVNAAAVRQRLDRVSGLFPELTTFLDRPAWALSGGQQQMVAIGRGLMSDPEVLLLDEPSLGLAPLVVRDLLRALDALRGGDMGVLLVEQNVQAGLSIADRGVVLERGRISMTGTPEQLLANDAIVRSYLSESA
jgi:branched-chain amino acid transport system ATP-binding protein